MRKIFSDAQIQFIKDNYRSMTYQQIADSLGGFAERQIRGKINGMGLGKNRQFKKDYFAEIDSADRAYWLGFLYADGWITRNHSGTYEIAMELNREDDYILKDFAAALGDAHAVTYSHNKKSFNGYDYETDSAILRIYSKELAEDLIRHGVVERKTSSDTFPKSGVFLRDFVRGYLDGDGCIYLNNSRSKQLTVVHFTNASTAFLSYLNTAIFCELGINGSIYTEKDRKSRLMYFRQSDVKKLLDWIYYDTSRPMLRRKYNKYKMAYGLAA